MMRDRSVQFRTRTLSTVIKQIAGRVAMVPCTRAGGIHVRQRIEQGLASGHHGDFAQCFATAGAR